MRTGKFVSYQEAQPSRFLDLPAELGFEILTRLLQYPGTQVSNFITNRTMVSPSPVLTYSHLSPNAP